MKTGGEMIILKIMIWYSTKFMEKYPRGFSKFYRKLRGILFAACIRLYKPRYFFYEYKNHDPNSSAYRGMNVWDFGDISAYSGEGGHPYAIPSLGFIESSHWVDK